MPLFGEKRFKKREKARIEDDLDQPPPGAPINSVGKEKESFNNFDYLIRKANAVFGFNGWSHSVTYQSIDYMDFDNGKYDVGVSALVKVILKDGSFHEDVGYGIAKGLKCKGTCIEKARKLAASDGLRNALRAFGTYFESTSHSRKITEFLSPSRNLINNNLPSTSGIKRNLSTALGSPPSTEAGTVSPTQPPSSPLHGNSKKKLFLQKNTGLESSDLNTSPSREAPMPSSNRFSNTVSNGTPKVNVTVFDAETNANNNEDAQQMTSPQQIKDQLSEKDKRHRKIKQLKLEIEAREKLKNALIAESNSNEGNSFTLRTLLKQEEPDCD